MKTFLEETKEIQPGVYFVAGQICYGYDSACARYREVKAKEDAAAAPVVPYAPEYKRKPGTKIYGV